MALVGVAAVAVSLRADPFTAQVGLFVAAGVAVCVLLAAGLAAQTMSGDDRGRRGSAARHRGVSEDMARQLGELALVVTRGRHELADMAERASRGQRPPRRSVQAPAEADAGPLGELTDEVALVLSEAWNAVLDATAAQGPAGRGEVLVSFAMRLQLLAHRAIRALDALENQVEDPDLLRRLFQLDHLVTLIRRDAESLGVIGGAVSRRRWTRPVAMYEVLRSAAAEVESYSRVKVVPPVDGMLHGDAVAAVIHLLAELIGNATKFAPHETQVMLRAETVPAGLAVEIEDRGLVPNPETRARLNSLLTDFEPTSMDTLLRDGRIGLVVVATLARQHGVTVRLQTNVFGGTQAIVVIPRRLLDTEQHDSDHAQPAPQPPTGPPSPSAALGAPSPAPTAETAASAPAKATGADGRDGGASGQEPAAGTPVPEWAGASPGQGGLDGRPPLPRRRAQSSSPPRPGSDALPRGESGPAAGHDPQLMAAFQQGQHEIREQKDRPPDATDD